MVDLNTVQNLIYRPCCLFRPKTPGRRPAGYIPLYACRLALGLALAVAFASLFLALEPYPVLAQAPDAEVDFFIKPAKIDEPDQPPEPLTVGDQITLRLQVDHPANSRVILPQLEPEWGDFEVVDQTPPETVNHEDGTATTARDIVVTLFVPGQYETPPLVVTHRQPDGSIEELAAPVINVNITSVLTEDLELRDLKPQAELAVPPIWPRVVGGLLASILLAGLLYGTVMWLYHRRKTRPVPQEVPMPVIDTRPPEVIAYAELDRIEALNLPAQNKLKQHYTLVSDCLRAYIEGRYRVPALEQTTAELRSAFTGAGLPMAHLSAFMTILAESDLVKFARYSPPVEQAERLIDEARAVVGATTPQPEPEEMSAPVPEPEVMP